MWEGSKSTMSFREYPVCLNDNLDMESLKGKIKIILIKNKNKINIYIYIHQIIYILSSKNMSQRNCLQERSQNKFSSAGDINHLNTESKHIFFLNVSCIFFFSTT